MVSFSPDSLPPLSLRHNGRLIRRQEAQRHETDFICWFSRADTGMVLWGWIFPWFCVSGGHRKTLFFLSFNCRISEKSQLVSVWNMEISCGSNQCFAASCCCCRVFFPPSSHVDVFFPSAFEFSTSLLKIGLSAHTPLHKLNSPLFKPWQAFQRMNLHRQASFKQRGWGWRNCRSRSKSCLSVTI